MSLNLVTALNGERVSTTMVADTICDPDTCFIISNVNTYNASKVCIYSSLLLKIFAAIIDKHSKSRSGAVCLGLHCLPLLTLVIYAADDINR